ncbi:MAG: hypothetical protein A3G93_06605 [Nitrospinae bacterium RIFCSPLOWO2_12_FULL_45_22]|nr:MAG: hypothetical protein A3G93_06605 [Nitrospinae bacterium RIFCSPLOWO2_12_FULL_45_22]
MKIGLCVIDLYLPGNNSLKDKRQILKSIKDRIRNKFNVSIAEIEDNDKWRKTTLGVVTINNDSTQVSNILQSVINFIEGFYPAQIINYQIELF